MDLSPNKIKDIVKAAGLYQDTLDMENNKYNDPTYFLDIIVDPGQELLRVDKYVHSKSPNISRSKIKRMLEEGKVLINGQKIKPNVKVKPGDRIQVEDIREEPEESIQAEDCLPPIVYEDGDILVVNKPVDMICHPGAGINRGTLLNGLAQHFEENREEYTLPRLGLIHRIDRNTSGLLVIAKKVRAMRKLQSQFFEHTVNRKYIALVWGDVPENEGTIDAPIGRHPRQRNIMTVVDEHQEGKRAVTHYKVLERFGYVTLIECRLETGRTHQIRVHMKHLGHPLFNDTHYGGDRILKGTVFSKYKQFIENNFKIMQGHSLHAQTLGFVHPDTKEDVFFEAPLPEYFSDVLTRWRRYTQGHTG